jgi:hypothetical protein
MKISAVMAMWMSAVFALVCFSVAYTGFSALQGLTDAAERELSVGYAWFWTFLGVIATIFGFLSWMIKKGKFGPVE